MIVLCSDASFDKATGMAGVAVTSTRGRVYCFDVLPAVDNNDAEALACIRACQVLCSRRGKDWTKGPYVVKTDSEGTVFGLERELPIYESTSDLQRLIAAKQIVIIKASRTDVESAHTAAKQALRIWLAAKRGEKASWYR